MEQHHNAGNVNYAGFNACNLHQLEELKKIKNSFPVLDHNIIQYTFEILNDTELCLKLLRLAFPKKYTGQIKGDLEKLMARPR